MWWVILVLIVIIVVLWWLLRKNAMAVDTTSHEVHKTTAEVETPIELAEEKAEVVSQELGKPDDLTIIEGIGPKISSILQEAGITTFAQLANQEPAYLKGLLEQAGLRLGDPTTWPQQARLAAEGNWDGLKELQDSLKGGRVVE